MVDVLKRLLARAFSIMFLAAAASLAVVCAVDFVHALGLSRDKDVIGGIVAAVNTAFIALATFELGIGIGKEYTLPEAGADLYPVVRRTITRFVSVACIALVLEALILVIKYSQLELVGNLFYPVAVMAGASLLLVALGIFIHLSRPDAAREPADAPALLGQPGTVASPAGAAGVAEIPPAAAPLPDIR
jgi:hypothetical protein